MDDGDGNGSRMVVAVIVGGVAKDPSHSRLTFFFFVCFCGFLGFAVYKRSEKVLKAIFKSCGV